MGCEEKNLSSVPWVLWLASARLAYLFKHGFERAIRQFKEANYPLIGAPNAFLDPDKVLQDIHPEMFGSDPSPHAKWLLGSTILVGEFCTTFSYFEMKQMTFLFCVCL